MNSGPGIIAFWTFIFYGEIPASGAPEDFLPAFRAGELDALCGLSFATCAFHS